MDLWQKMKTEYVSGKVETLRELAEKYKKSDSAIRKKAAAEHWSEQKNNFATKVEQKTLSKIASDDVKSSVDRISKIDSVNTALLGKIEELANISVAETITPKDIKILSGALKDITSILLEINGAKNKNDENEGTGVIVLPEIRGESQ